MMTENQNKKLNKTLLNIAIFSFLGMLLLIIMVLGGKSFMDSSENEKKSKTGIPYSASILTNQTENLDYATFSGIGQIRLVPKQDPKNKKISTFVINPWFSFTKGDSQFIEELSRKTIAIKKLIKSYVESKTERELKSLGEEKVSSELLEIINKELVLNKISKIYFSEYRFLD